MSAVPQKKQPSAEIISRREIFNGYHRLEELTLRPLNMKSDGYAEPMNREVFYCKPVVSTILYLPEEDAILLNQQFRVGAMLSGAEDPFLFECSAGVVDDGEDLIDAAKREAFEETGAAVKEIEKIGTCHTSPGCVAEIFHLYLARIEKPKTGFFGLEDEGEQIKTHLIPVSKIMDMLDSGKITNAPTALMLNWFGRHHARLRKKWGAT